MNSASLALTVAISLCFALEVTAKETVLLPTQQNNCANARANAKIKTPAANQRPAELRNGTVQTQDKKNQASKKEHPIDLVICLDTSSSMNGLIDSAKQKIWDIVNELATAKPRPHLRVGLYAYGSPSFGSASGFVHKQVDLTDDLDKVFTELSSLSTNGGDEYCARVISTATSEQPWNKDKKTLKIIVDAGNEPATQDPRINVFDAARAAASQGIIVNMIFCGSPSNPQSSDWRKVATMSDGQFAAIDQNNGTVVTSTPFDQKLAELSGSINNTYIAYGREGQYGQQKQMEADYLSQSLGASNFASRAVAKIGGQYRNSSWDLVDASKEQNFDLSKCKKEELPLQMQKMSTDERKAYLNKKVNERAGIQKQIAALSAQRTSYIQEELKKSGKSTDKAFDNAMLSALRQQAQRNGFTFDSK